MIIVEEVLRNMTECKEHQEAKTSLERIIMAVSRVEQPILGGVSTGCSFSKRGIAAPRGRSNFTIAWINCQAS